MTEELITQKQVADLLKISPDAVRAFARTHADFPRKLKLSPTMNGRVRYRRAEVENWIRARFDAA